MCIRDRHLGIELLIILTTMSNKKKRFILPEEEIPQYWYNIQADLSLIHIYTAANTHPATASAAPRPTPHRQTKQSPMPIADNAPTASYLSKPYRTPCPYGNSTRAKRWRQHEALSCPSPGGYNSKRG